MRPACCSRVCLPGVVEKVRWLVPVGGLTYEVDEFLGVNAGLTVAEIELPAVEAPFERPRLARSRSDRPPTLLQFGPHTPPPSANGTPPNRPAMQNDVPVPKPLSRAVRRSPRAGVVVAPRVPTAPVLVRLLFGQGAPCAPIDRKHTPGAVL